MLSIEPLVTKLTLECADDEIALDTLAQWALMNHDDRVEESYKVIMDNLSSRFNISQAISSAYIERLREYNIKFTLMTANLEAVRSIVLGLLLQSDLGEKWRNRILQRVSKSSPEAKRVVYMICYMVSRGFDFNNDIEANADRLRALYNATFGSTISDALLSRLVEIAILERIPSKESSGQKYSYAVMRSLSVQSLPFDGAALRPRINTRQFISRLVPDLFPLFDELTRKYVKKLESEESVKKFPNEKGICSCFNGWAAISPFVADEVHTGIIMARGEGK